MLPLRIFSGVAALSLVPLLFLSDHQRAAATATASSPASTAMSPSATPGRISGEPATGPSTPQTPPAPSPLAPLARPVDESVGVGSPSPSDLIDSGARLNIAGAALGSPSTSPAMPATPPPDLIDDSKPITGSGFDRDDHLDRHPVDSVRSITGSTFDREDRVDEHPVP